jgi:hypothetical protein
MILFAVAAIAQWNVSDIIADDTRALQRAYEQCVSVSAKRFARSRDDADIVAAAAITECRPKKQAYFAALNGDSIETSGKPFGPKFLSIMEKKLDEKVRNEALLVITKVRSGR